MKTIKGFQNYLKKSSNIIFKISLRSTYRAGLHPGITLNALPKSKEQVWPDRGQIPARQHESDKVLRSHRRRTGGTRSQTQREEKGKTMLRSSLFIIINILDTFKE